MADLDLARLILVIVISAGALDVHRQSTFAQNRARAFLASTSMAGFSIARVAAMANAGQGATGDGQLTATG